MGGLSPGQDFEYTNYDSSKPSIADVNARSESEPTFKKSATAKPIITDLDAEQEQDSNTPQSGLYEQSMDGSPPEYPNTDRDTKRKVDLSSAKKLRKRFMINRAKRPLATKARQPCHFFAQGKCNRGEQCYFSHATSTSPRSIVLHRRSPK